jgi:YidC/Oxa1 family membrane protein insertase
MNIIHQIWTLLVWQPQLNIIALFYRATQDIGWAIIGTSLIINLPLWYLFAKSYINMQKTRMLQPQMKEIQDKYKEDPLEMRKHVMGFYKKHNVSQAATFQMMFLQIFFVTGVYYIVIELSKGKMVSGLYKFIFGSETATFLTKAFGSIDIGDSSTKHIWIVALSAILSYFYGYYTFKIAPQIKLPDPVGRTQEEIDQAKTMEKTAMFVGLYLSPILLTVLNLSVPVGVNIYIIGTTILATLRQMFITNYYAKETKQLYKDIVESDMKFSPEVENSLDSTDIIDLVESSPITVIDNSNSPKKDLYQNKRKKKK